MFTSQQGVINEWSAVLKRPFLIKMFFVQRGTKTYFFKCPEILHSHSSLLCLLFVQFLTFKGETNFKVKFPVRTALLVVR